MRIRKGFVSNSSSSSFIIGIGKIKNGCKDKLENFVNHYDSGCHFWNVSKDSSCDDFLYDAIEINHDMLEVFSVTNQPVKISLEIDKSSEYFIVNIGNDEGDGIEFYLDDTGEMNWYIAENPEFFEGFQRDIIRLFETNEFFEESVWKIGAYRNG